MTQMIELNLSQPAFVEITMSNAGYDSLLYVRSDCETLEPSNFCDDAGFSEEFLIILV